MILNRYCRDIKKRIMKGIYVDKFMDKKVRNKQKKQKVNVNRPIPIKRIAILSLFTCIAIILLIGRIGWLQFVQGAELKEKASRQQTLNQIISPKRGTIYDSNGKALAISAKVDTVSINPKNIKNENKEKVAKALSDIFELDYETTLSQVKSNASVVTIAKKVEHDKVSLLQTWMSDNKISAGINIDEDTKRYYPYNTLAAHIIGFTGTDSQGLYGIEAKWDSTLTGVAGKIVTTADVNNKEISSEASQYVEVENGSDLYLTIDVNIQSIMEKYLAEGVAQANASGGSAIAMNPKTGDILGMATYPSYNLNDPFTITDIDTSLMSPQEKTNALYERWSDKNVSSAYEPGSTFKTIMTAIALEENYTKEDVLNDFSCPGSIVVADRTIRCASREVHGSQTLKQALGNSCNVAFIQLGQRIGFNNLYKYFQAFGLFDKTGIALTGESSSRFFEESNRGPVQLATMSFGQRFEITPLQLVTAVSSIANGGKLMQPRIVKQVVTTDSDSKNVTTIEPVTVRTVISEETAKKVCSMLEYVVTDGGGKKGAVKGYRIGGKTGTAEGTSIAGSHYNISSVSFMAVAPSEDAEIVLLTVLYYPQTSSSYGSTLVAPVVSKMLSEILPYMGIVSGDAGTGSTSANLVSVPNVTNKTLTEAVKILKNSGLKVSYADTPDANSILVTEQVPPAGMSLYTNSTIALYTTQNSIRTSVPVPNLTGYTLAQARSVLANLNLNLKYVGSGTVSYQDVATDTLVEEGTVITVTLK